MTDSINITRESQTKRLRALANAAIALRSKSGLLAAINAEREINKLHGLIVDRTAIENDNVVYVYSDQPLTDEEWEAEVAAGLVAQNEQCA